MRAKIRTAKNEENRYYMIAILPSGGIEYPQEKLGHDKKSQVFDDARAMYSNPPWNWRESDHTIVVDE